MDENENDVKLKNKPKDTAFRQQRLKAWQPILTPIPVIIFFIVIGIVFVPLGAILKSSSDDAIDQEFRYDNSSSCRTCQTENSCTVNPTCTISVVIKDDMEPPIYFYYKLSNYYQNHRRYVKSRSDVQLRGEEVTFDDVEEACTPYVSENDLEQDAALWIPCGLIAKSFFTDRYEISTEDGEQIELQKEGIAWQSDLDYKFGDYPAGAPGVESLKSIGRKFSDEDFVVWMRTAGLPEFKKLHRIINTKLPAGTKLDITITNNSTMGYPVWQFDGTKSVVFSTTTWLGGKNPFLGYAYIVVGCISLVQGFAFLLKHLHSPRRLGDSSYLKWNR